MGANMITNLKISPQSLIAFINHDLLINREVKETVTLKTDLITSGIIDSLSLIQLVTYLEKEAEIEIQDVDVNPENFQSVESILNYLERRFE
jgi:acyl carrier protein